MSAKPTSLAKNLSISLAPKLKDTRKFRLAKPMVFTPDQAQVLASAFRQVITISGNVNLTMGEFFVALAGNVGGEITRSEI